VHPFFKPGHLIEEGDYTDDEKQKMLGLNACEFLGVDPTAYK
jgi:predicted TIM-barrel fold metal-dependent hydrolase